MKNIFISITILFLVGCNSKDKQKYTTVRINIEQNKCELIENGNGYKTKYVHFTGKIWEKDGQHYECAVEISKSDFKKALGSTCFLNGFNSTSSYFYKGEKSTLRELSCDFRQLKKGTYYFNAGGISSDSCSWTCF